MAVDWSTDIPRELVLCFANRLMVSLEDFIAFGAVCKSWSSAAMEAKENYLASISTSTSTGTITSTGLRLLAYQVPLLMLPVVLTLPRGVAGGDVTIGLYSLTAKGDKVYRRKLQDAKGKKCYSSLGWLVTVVTVSKELEFNLLHPFKHAINIPLPNSLIKYHDGICKFVISSSPSWTSDYVVMFHAYNTLEYCRPGLRENYWTKLSFPEYNYIRDLTYYRGQFYVVNSFGCVSVVCVCDIDDPKTLKAVAPKINQKELLGTRRPRIKQQYLVECAGALLLVLCLYSGKKYESTTACRVFEVPFDNGKSWKDSEVKNLGNRAIFLSQSSSSFCIEVTDYSGCKANCIYFMNNKVVSSVVNIDLGIYNMGNASIDREFGKSFNHGFKGWRGYHLWIQPSF
ncbi:hypothetical protein RchiOBHm_Chr1g0372911 [Rosa chinensis]|uniref:KIB1-4 beta-propeller domain-containing protein n=1 Tax=Rosa chinensis TaxID=74649 RepID=A0A2P6SLX2_ROSCH|nr:uncharacterized protein LOC112171304 [Rosa chinensis]PRQ59687.1 hypothetical protein RchiOBHm_Chr1g0372911 [Rosa chinensis]